MIQQVNLACTSKPLKYGEALEILHAMHFNARVVRTGRRRGTKEIFWTTLDGVNYCTPFARERTWEEIIEFAKSQPPAWDKAPIFQKGDIIEMTWGRKRIRATVVKGLGEGFPDFKYTLDSPEFYCAVMTEKTHKDFTNYDLKFCKQAVKVGEVKDSQ